MLRAKGVCFSSSDRAIVLEDPESEEAGMSMTKKQAARRLPVIDGPAPVDPSDTSAPPRGVLVSPEKRALEDIKRQVGILDRFLHDLDLQRADEERYEELNQRYTELVTRSIEIGEWLNLIKAALEHHDRGELSPRQFANEVDAAIKGWEGR